MGTTSSPKSLNLISPVALLVLLFLLVGCASRTGMKFQASSSVFIPTPLPTETDPDAPTLIPVKNLNQDVVSRFFITDPDHQIKVGNTLDLELVNASNEPIVFSVGYGIRIFANSGSGWVEVKNKVEYFGSKEEIVIYPNQDVISTRSASVFPDIKNEGKPVEVIVFVIGLKKGSNDRSEEVAAYAKITLPP